uniref:SWIM-type domain-containing protein n=1 Tax=Globodera rostochiensis TaxID=31243 RepID=A0A914GYK0_GLORO
MINHLKTKNHEDALKLFESENAEMVKPNFLMWKLAGYRKSSPQTLQRIFRLGIVRLGRDENVFECSCHFCKQREDIFNGRAPFCKHVKEQARRKNGGKFDAY